MEKQESGRQGYQGNRAYSRLCGMQVLFGRRTVLFSMDDVPPYVLWREVIKDYLDCTPRQLSEVIGFYPGEVAKLVPEISRSLGRFLSLCRLVLSRSRTDFSRLFRSLSPTFAKMRRCWLFLMICSGPIKLRCCCCIIWLMAFPKSPLLLLGAYRSTDIDDKHPLAPVLTELNREGLLQSTHVKRMSFDRYFRDD